MSSSALVLPNPQHTIDEIITFLQTTFQNQGKSQAVIAVSGGIDSALALSLLTRAVSPSQIVPVLLPYGDQSIADSATMLSFNGIQESQWQQIDIAPIAQVIAAQLGLSTTPTTKAEQIRFGNVMARSRMIVVYDLARRYDALVCGTENKSEQHLGYFTRFGDGASDIEPIQHLYKTQVRQLAEFLNLPEQIRVKPPTAGLWTDQTDETELGFTYTVADQVLAQLIDEHIPVDQIVVEGVSPLQIQQVVAKVTANQFKHQVPYVLEEYQFESR